MSTQNSATCNASSTMEASTYSCTNLGAYLHVNRHHPAWNHIWKNVGITSITSLTCIIEQQSRRTYWLWTCEACLHARDVRASLQYCCSCQSSQHIYVFRAPQGLLVQQFLILKLVMQKFDEPSRHKAYGSELSPLDKVKAPSHEAYLMAQPKQPVLECCPQLIIGMIKVCTQ